MGSVTHLQNSRSAHSTMDSYLVARWMNIRYGIPYLCFIHGEDINVATTSREVRVYRVLANSLVGFCMGSQQVTDRLVHILARVL